MSVVPRPSETSDIGLTRSALLRRAGAAAAGLAVLGGGAPYAFAGPLKYRNRSLKGSLSIVQWAHFVPKYDAWLGTWAKSWGEKNDVKVDIDHVAYTRLPELAAKEAAAKRGHDVFGFLSPPALYEDLVVDHASIVEEVERTVGPYGGLARMSTYNPRTKKYFGVSDAYVPAPIIWRHDLWNSVGESPATWDHVLAAAPKLRSLGHPLGIGMANEPDSNTALLSLMLCFGSSLQDESNALAIDSPETVAAVEFMADLYSQGEESAVFDWDAASNNELALGGRGSLIVNAISAIRRAEALELPFSKDLWMWPVPRGPQARIGLGQYTGVYSIWRFAKNIEAAERFVADLCLASEEAVLASQLFNFPSFPGAFPVKKLYKAAAADTNLPKGKYTILATVASRYTRNAGYPGTSNAAVQEVLDRFLIPQMFAQVAQGKTGAAESVRSTAQEMKRFWARWRKAGKI